MKKGLQSIVNASTKIASGFGCEESNLGSCVLMREAKRLMSGCPQRSIIWEKTVLLSIHSFLTLNTRDCLSALTLSTQAMGVAVSQIFLMMHQDHIR